MSFMSASLLRAKPVTFHRRCRVTGRPGKSRFAACAQGLRARVRATLLLSVAGLLLGPGAPLLREARSAPPISGIHCPDSAIPAATAPNYCSDLVPTPDLGGVTAVLELAPARSPFAVALTADGHPRYVLATVMEGLPAPSALGAYTVYVAWATSLMMDSVAKLGVAHNGRAQLGESNRTQFRILVTAERSANVPARTGRLVLRGTSPSVRLLAHRDLTPPFAPGASSGSMPAMPMPGGWAPPPPTGPASAMPSMRRMQPSVTSRLPGQAVDPATLSEARPRETLALRSGDTLSLTAMLVRRTIAGRTFVAYGYNGEYPGPLITVAQGTSIVVRFRNDTDVPSAVHWHGVRLDNASDGAVGLTQEAVPPGGMFTYTVRFPDAGVFWYHSHEREDIQQALGLYGNIIVTPRARDYYEAVNGEEVVAIQDVLLDSVGAFPFGATAPTHALMGRFGNVFLINGEARYSRTVNRGAVIRFFLTNVSNARIYNLSFGDARMKLVASDLGKYEDETLVESILIAPAERYVVDVQFDRPGTVVLANRVQALNHVFGTFLPEIDTLGTIRVRPERATPDYSTTFTRPRHNAEVAADVERYRPYVARAVDRELDLEMRVHGLPSALTNMLTGASVPVDMSDGMGVMNWLATANEVTWILRDPVDRAENMEIVRHWKQGSVAKIRFYNDPVGPHPMAHPIHMHGQRMLVLSRNGVPTDDLVWKDTVLIPAGEIVDVLLELSNRGRWMLHCHIAEHRGAGMMTNVIVEP